MGLVKSAGVSAAAALIERRLAQALYSYRTRISSGDMALLSELDSCSELLPCNLANRNTHRVVSVGFRRGTGMIGLAVRRERAASHIRTVVADGFGNGLAEIGVLARELGGLAESEAEQVVHY